LSVTCGRSVVFSGYSGYLHQEIWPPRYNWNIVESSVKHHKPNQTKNAADNTNLIEPKPLHKWSFSDKQIIFNIKVSYTDTVVPLVHSKKD
jgi:hypothetical protein